MKTKSETCYLIKSFINMVNTQYDAKVKCIRSDNGPEYKLTDSFANKGIEHQTSCVECPQQNGRVERKHQHIQSVARALIHQSSVPKVFWTFAVLHAVYLINRLLSKKTDNMSPFHIINSKIADISNFKCFGFLCYASTLTNNRKKLDNRARMSIFIGYKKGMKGYIVFDLNNREIFISRNVRFYEDVFPFSNKQVEADSATPSIFKENPLNNNLRRNILDIEEVGDTTEEANPEVPVLRRSTRDKRPPRHVNDYLWEGTSNTAAAVKRQGNTKTKYPISNYISYDSLSNNYKHVCLAITSDEEPASFEEAIRQPCWKKLNVGTHQATTWKENCHMQLDFQG